MKNIDVICIKLDNLEEKIVSKKLLLSLISDVVHDKPEKYLKNLRESRKIKAIFQKYYYILSENEKKINILDYSSNELVYGVLNKLNIKWHITFEKGLELNNVLWQAHSRITILNNKISRSLVIFGIMFDFKKTKIKYCLDSIKIKTRNRITQNIGLNEKIFIDYIYFRRQVPIELISKIDKSKVLNLLKIYPKSFQKKVREVLMEYE